MFVHANNSLNGTSQDNQSGIAKGIGIFLKQQFVASQLLGKLVGLITTDLEG